MSSSGSILDSSTPSDPLSDSGPQLKVVYRILRLISDWALSGFFAEVYVEGTANVRSEGAVILTPSHHNEIIDIATLSATVPHRRIIAYWTKASLFKNPVARFILRSAGAIPVARVAEPHSSRAQNVDGSGSDNGGDASVDGSWTQHSRSKQGGNGHEELFDVTYRELSKAEAGGGVLGVFPEGTSYTMPRIVQVKEGAARAALGYLQWLQNNNGSVPRSVAKHGEIPVVIIPVGIVYTNKSCYRSRVYVQYGPPIDLKSFIGRSGLDMSEGTGHQSVARELTEEIRRGMFRLTINAPDWDTRYAAQLARAILWPNEKRLALQNFVKVSKILVNLFQLSSIAVVDLRLSLLRYHALLYHTDLAHADLTHVSVPYSRHPSPRPAHSSASAPGQKLLTRSDALRLVGGLPALLSPLVLSLPTHIAHAPAYAFGSLASRIFSGEEEEARAQYKVVFGGLGRVVGTLAVGFSLVRTVPGRSFLRMVGTVTEQVGRIAIASVGRALLSAVPKNSISLMEGLGGKLAGLSELTMNIMNLAWTKLGRSVDIIGIFGIAWLLLAWHSRVIDVNYIRYKRARATLMILRAIVSSRRADEMEIDEVNPYLTTPPPPLNRYIAKSLQSAPKDTAANLEGSSSGISSRTTKPDTKDKTKVAKSTLVRHVLLARAEAVWKLHSVFRELEGSGKASPGVDDDECSLRADEPLSPHDKVDKEDQHRYDVQTNLATLRECGAVF